MSGESIQQLSSIWRECKQDKTSHVDNVLKILISGLTFFCHFITHLQLQPL